MWALSSLTHAKFSLLGDSSLNTPPTINHEDNLLEPLRYTEQESSIILVKQNKIRKTRYPNATGNKKSWTSGSENHTTKLVKSRSSNNRFLGILSWYGTFLESRSYSNGYLLDHQKNHNNEISLQRNQHSMIHNNSIWPQYTPGETNILRRNSLHLHTSGNNLLYHMGRL